MADVEPTIIINDNEVESSATIGPRGKSTTTSIYMFLTMERN